MYASLIVTSHYTKCFLLSATAHIPNFALRSVYVSLKTNCGYSG